MPFVTEQSGKKVVLRLHVQPKASKAGIVGLYGDSLKVAVAAPPVDGKANEEVLVLVASLLEVSMRQVSLKAGAQSRRKTVLISGCSAEEVRHRLFPR